MSDILTHLPGLPPYQRAPDVNYEAFDSLGDLVNLALRYKKREKEEKCRYMFRGETKCFPVIRPSLFNTKQQSKGEHLFYQKAISSAPEHFQHLQTTFDRLTQMRHYEFPTRLLDVSENILTALFMALDGWLGNQCNKLYCEHPEIYSEEKFLCPRIDVIRVPEGRIKEAESDLVINLTCLAKVKDEFTPAMWWHEIRKDNPDFHEEAFLDHFDECFNNWCVYPRLTNPRILMQQGLFILFGLPEDALCGKSIACFRHKEQCKDYKIQKTANEKTQYIPLPRDSTSDEIAHVAWLMPSANAVAKHDSFVDYIKALSDELSTLGYDQHTMYRDDFVKHANYWREHI